MVKKRKSKSKSSGRKRSGGRIRGARENEALQMLVGGLIGAFGLSFLNQKVAFLQGKIGAIAELLVGAVMVWKFSNPVAKGLGMGFAIAGGTSTAKSFGLLSGIGASRGFQRRSMNAVRGFRDVAQIGQPFPKPSAVGALGRAVGMSNMYAGIYGAR